MTTQDQIADRTLGRLEANVDNLVVGVAKLESKLAQTRDILNQTNTLIDRTNILLDQMNAKIDRLFYAIIGIGGGIIAALIAMILRGT